jgi:hypothetical protein
LSPIIESDDDPIDQVEQRADHFGCAGHRTDQLGAFVGAKVHWPVLLAAR